MASVPEAVVVAGAACWGLVPGRLEEPPRTHSPCSEERPIAAQPREHRIVAPEGQRNLVGTPWEAHPRAFDRPPEMEEGLDTQLVAEISLGNYVFRLVGIGIGRQ